MTYTETGTVAPFTIYDEVRARQLGEATEKAFTLMVAMRGTRAGDLVARAWMLMDKDHKKAVRELAKLKRDFPHDLTTVETPNTAPAHLAAGVDTKPKPAASK